MNNYAIVECTTNNIKSNLLCYSSLCSIRSTGSIADIYVITYNNNPFIEYYKQLNAKLVFVSDSFVRNFKNVNTNGWSYFVFSRFLIFKEQVFKKYNFILYLDTDTLIYKNLDSYYDEFMKIPIFGMVPEQMLAFRFEMPRILNVIKTKNARPQSCQDIIFQPTNTKYCNSGVFIINKNTLTDLIYDDLMSMIKYEFTTNDQDILNIYFGNKTTFMDPKFNFTFDTFKESYFEKDQSKIQTDVVIQHLCGANFTANTKLQPSLQHLSKTIQYVK